MSGVNSFGVKRGKYLLSFYPTSRGPFTLACLGRWGQFGIASDYGKIILDNMFWYSNYDDNQFAFFDNIFGSPFTVKID